MSKIDIQVSESKRFLERLNFDAERCNERSALVFLALLGLKPSQSWTAVSRPLLTTREIMDWIRDKYDKDYAPNSRETIRRHTLHQFITAGVVVQNPDDPARAINSPNNCYQLTEDASLLALLVGTAEFDRECAQYLEALPGLRQIDAMERKQQMIPVKLLDGSPVELTPGGQNVLIAAIIDDFCSRWTPDARVLYVGDAGKNDPVFEAEALAELGIELDKHGKLPDLIIYMSDRNWLVLIEAASSHGPIDAKRKRELDSLFEMSTAGLVFVSCFPTRVEMRKYLSEIAWESEVWCADSPTHLIHFNGERFLGPYCDV